MLCCTHKAAGKPKWQRGTRPQEPEARAALSIIARNEKAFTRAFLKTMRDLFASKPMADFRKAIRSNETSIERILDTVPWYNEADPDSVAFWVRLQQSLERAYTSTIEDTGQYATRRYRLPMKFEVGKAAVRADVKIVVPINPYSKNWIRQKSATLVKEISQSQRNRLRRILSNNFSQGIRPEAILEEIGNTVGLTEIQSVWVANRQRLSIAQGLSLDDAQEAARRFGERLLVQRASTIARTETVDAHTKGLEDTWRVASENGFMAPGTEKEWVSMEDERVSDICEELNGTRVPVDQPFDSSIVGPVDRPPAHPNCRSTMILRF